MPDARNPTIVYCSFLECIRQVNKNNLVRLNSELIAISRVTRYAILRLPLPVLHNASLWNAIVLFFCSYYARYTHIYGCLYFFDTNMYIQPNI